MINLILIKVIYTQKIYLKQNINCQLKNVKLLEEGTLAIQKLLLNTQMMWLIFIKTLKNTAQIIIILFYHAKKR